MFNQKTFLLNLFTILFVNVVFAQENELKNIDVQDLKRHLEFISSDELQGRNLKTEINGLEITASYLAEQAAKIGLSEITPGYFQDVPLQIQKSGKTSVQLLCSKKKKNNEFTDIINLSSDLGNLSIENKEIVLAGFAENDSCILALTKNMVEGKILLVSQSTKSVFDEGKEFRWNNQIERTKIEKLGKLNPAALFFVTLPADKEKQTFTSIKRWTNRETYSLAAPKNEKANVPTFIVLPEFADEILGGKGKWNKYLSHLNKPENSACVETYEKQLSVYFETVAEAIPAKNVVGIISGSDEKLKDECVVIMAHYDHLGMDKNGEVFNGADDNGSGTVLLLEVAEAFAKMKNKPKRSMLFLWVTGEEIGMFGSRFYSENPIFPMEKTKVCINIDMAGRVYEPRDSVWKKSPKMVKDFDGLFTLSNDVWPELKEINQRNCEKLGLIPDTSLPDNFLRTSDHYHFHHNGVPILNLATGYHADYHKVGDEVDKINFQKLKRVADLCFLVAEEIANQ